MPKQPQAEQRYRDEFAHLLQNAGWHVASYPEAPREIDFLINKDGLLYLVELKRSPESRRDRLVPLLSEAILQAQAHVRQLQRGQPLAVVASHSLSASAIEQVLKFAEQYAGDVGIGLFDEQGVRVFRAPGLEELNSFSPERQAARPISKPKSYPLFSDLGQWMLKVLLAQHIAPQYLRAPRQNIRSASELASAANVSQMSASRLIRQLQAESFLDSHAQKLRLVRINDLLEEWQSASRRAYEEIPCRWVIPGHGSKQLQSALRSYSADALSQPQSRMVQRSPRVCLGLFSAAEALGLGFVHGVPPIIYLERLDPEVLDRLGISSSKDDRADVNVRIPANKESIFRAAVDREGLPVSDGVQIWLDVSSHPARGKEQAEHIRRQIFASLLEQ